MKAKISVERDTQLWRWMRKTTSCKKTSESPGCSSSLIGQKNFFFGQSEAGNSTASGTSNCPGTRLNLTRNFYHGHFIDPANCPEVSEVGKSVEGLKNSDLNWTRICCKKWFTKTIESKYSAKDALIKKCLCGMC